MVGAGIQPTIRGFANGFGCRVFEALERHCATGGIAQQPLELIAAVGWHVGVGMEGKAVDAGTAGAGQGWTLACVAKARADAP